MVELVALVLETHAPLGQLVVVGEVRLGSLGGGQTLIDVRQRRGCLAPGASREHSHGGPIERSGDRAHSHGGPIVRSGDRARHAGMGSSWQSSSTLTIWRAAWLAPMRWAIARQPFAPDRHGVLVLAHRRQCTSRTIESPRF